MQWCMKQVQISNNIGESSVSKELKQSCQNRTASNTQLFPWKCLLNWKASFYGKNELLIEILIFKYQYHSIITWHTYKQTQQQINVQSKWCKNVDQQPKVVLHPIWFVNRYTTAMLFYCSLINPLQIGNLMVYLKI